MLFLSHLRTWLIASIILVFTFPLLADNGWFSIDDELAKNSASYGLRRNRECIQLAQQRFSSWFITTGWYEKSKAGDHVDQNRQGLAAIGPGPASFFEGYIEKFWASILRAMYRWEINKHWYFILGVTAFIGVAEGIGRRSIRSARGGYNNPVETHITTHFLIIKVMGIFFVLPWVPFTLDGLMWVIAIVLSCIFFVRVTMSIQTGTKPTVR